MPIGSVIGTSIRRPLQAARLVGAGYGWLTRTSPHETPEMRAWMLANVASQTTPVLVGSAAVVATAGAIIGLTGETWPLLWLAFELTVTVLRLILIVQVSRNATPETTDENTARRPHRARPSLVGRLRGGRLGGRE
ncbi:hypothetical protein [Enterovirga rhinocerotis]|uniref:hypothetical protein n=1 Tax=Enterovirga rhinocerotis TaxID=1339210 RepID=UPI00105DD3F5|nr:hypothetical protein [Enterovirga rhinocerotis]